MQLRCSQYRVRRINDVLERQILYSAPESSTWPYTAWALMPATAYGQENQPGAGSKQSRWDFWSNAPTQSWPKSKAETMKLQGDALLAVPWRRGITGDRGQLWELCSRGVSDRHQAPVLPSDIVIPHWGIISQWPELPRLCLGQLSPVSSAVP